MPKLVTLAAALVLVPLSAHAGAAMQEIGRLRRAVGEYDPNGDLAQVVWDLGSLTSSPDARIAMEAHYLRAMVVTDVLVYLDLHPAPWLRERIADAMGTSPARLEDALSVELETLELPFVAQANALEGTLRALRSDGVTRPAPDDVRGAILLVSRLGKMSTPDAREALASIGRDPCTSAAPCPAPYANLSSDDRRIIEGLAVAARALRAVEAPSVADPLAALAFPALAGASEGLRALRIATDPRGAWAALDADPIDAVVTPALLVAVRGEDVRIARRATFAIRADGFVRSVAGGVPSFPASTEVAVTKNRDVRVLARLLAPEISASDGTVGLFVDPRAPASALGRVILALSQAGARDLSVAVSRGDGAVAFVSTRFAPPGLYPASARGAGRLRVLVTAIGYWVFEGRRDPVQVPLAAPGGAHDTDGLRHELGDRANESAAVACRGEIEAQPVLLAALALRRAGTEPPTVVVTP